MTDIGARRPPETAMHLGLEWQQSEDMIDVAAHHPRAAGPPRPDRGRDVFDNRNFRIGGADPPRDTAGKARTVDDDENVRTLCDDSSRSEAHEPQDFWQASRNSAEA